MNGTAREIKWDTKQTGYCRLYTEWTITQKFAGSDPDIQVYQAGQYKGHLTLSTRDARHLAKTLLFLVGEQES